MAKAAKKPEGYNGWTNHATWCLALWIDNEEPSYRYWREAAGQARATHGIRPGKANLPRAIQNAANELAERLKTETQDGMPTGFTNAGGYTVADGFWSDMLSAAVSDVNWYEIALNWINEAP